MAYGHWSTTFEGKLTSLALCLREESLFQREILETKGKCFFCGNLTVAKNTASISKTFPNVEISALLNISAYSAISEWASSPGYNSAFVNKFRQSVRLNIQHFMPVSGIGMMSS